MKILIGYPPLESKRGVPLLSQNRQFQWFHNPTHIFPLIPASAATLLKEKGYEVVFKDAIVERMSWEEFEKFLEKENFDFFAFETKTPVIKQHWQIIDHLKSKFPTMKVVIMGDHVTALPEETMQNCRADFVLTGGDFDFMLLNLAKHLSEGLPLEPGFYYREKDEIKNTGQFQLNHNLDVLPLVDRYLTKDRLYNIEYNLKGRPFAYTMAGRDCPWHRCAFCSWTTLFNAFRTRSPESLLGEIGFLIEKYKVKEIFDDTGTFPPGVWLENFCRGMMERGYHKKIKFSCNMRVDFINEENAKLMKRAGFRLLKVGLESANQKTLGKLSKNTTVQQIKNACKIATSAGLEVHLTIMVGYPWETKIDALNTLNLAKDLMFSGKADILQSTVIIPYPGTHLFQEAVANDWFRFNPQDYEKYDMSEPVLKTADMEATEVMAVCNKVYKIYTSPRYILSRLKKIRNFNDIKYHLQGLKAVFGHLKDFK